MESLPAHYPSLDWQEKKAVREQYVKLQGGKCCHCGEPLSSGPQKSIADKWLNLRLFPKDFLKWPVHLHHDHTTQMTIGAVHAKCNGVLWQYHGE